MTGRCSGRGAGLAVGVCLVLASSPAWALFGGSSGKCDRTDNDRKEASRVIRNIAGRIDAMETTIVETLRKHAGQVSGYQAQSAKAIVEALGNHSKLRAQTEREVEENRAIRDRRPTRRGCRTATGTRGMAPARVAATKEKERAGVAGVGRIAGDRSVTQGSAADNSQRFESLMAKYCNSGKRGENAKACTGAAGRHAADMDPGNLFDRNRLVSEDDRRTAIEVSRNLAVPVVYDQFPVSSAETSQERRRVLLARSANTRSALAADFFAHARSIRAPGGGSRPVGGRAGAGEEFGRAGEPIRAARDSRRAPVREPGLVRSAAGDERSQSVARGCDAAGDVPDARLGSVIGSTKGVAGWMRCRPRSERRACEGFRDSRTRPRG